MATDREDLKGYFAAGQIPTQGQFAQLIDHSINQVDDNIRKDKDGVLRINGIGIELENSKLETIEPFLGFSRKDEDGRTHQWRFMHMSQKAGYNKSALELWEYRTDSNGKACGGDATKGAICGPRLVVLEGGNVGIGMPWPTEKLEVGGNAMINGSFYQNDGEIRLFNSTSKSSLHLRTDNAGNAFITNMNGIMGVAGEGNLDVNITGQRALYFRTGNKDLFGKIRLHIQENGDVFARAGFTLESVDGAKDNDEATNSLGFYRREENGADHTWRLYHMTKKYHNNALELWEYKSGANLGPKLIIYEGGNVGIAGKVGIGIDLYSAIDFPLVVGGTAEDPGQAVVQVGTKWGAHISGGGDGYAMIGTNIRRKNSSDPNNSLFTIYDHDGAYGYAGIISEWGKISFHAYKRNTLAGKPIDPNESLRMQIIPKKKADESAEYYLLYIKDRVGIGTTTPSEKLEVLGNLKIGSNGGLLKLAGNDHCYVEFYPDAGQGRKAWVGIGNANSTDFTIANEKPNGAIILSSANRIEATANLKVNGMISGLEGQGAAMLKCYDGHGIIFRWAGTELRVRVDSSWFRFTGLVAM